MLKSKTIFGFLAIMFLCGAATPLSGQGFVVNGVVRDKLTNEPLAGATVVEVGGNDRYVNGAVSDITGAFSLDASKAEFLLRVSFMGYMSADRQVAAGGNYEILLEEEISTVGEVVVTASRVSDNSFMPIARRDMSTTSVKISTTELTDSPAASIEEMLQGRISGVDITGGDGNPGAGLSIRIRGASSLNPNARPLIVIDGIPYETTIADGFDFSTADDEEIGAILDVAPSDIESIEVLKDAAASAVWGAQGANGVLLITTKRGERGTTKFDASYKMSVTFRPIEMPMLSGDQYIMLQKEAIFNSSGEFGAGNHNELNYDRSWYNYYNFAQNTDWVDEVTRLGLSHEANFSMMGGGEKSKYRASVGYLNQLGTTKGTSLKRLNTRMNLDYSVTEKLRFSANFSYVHSDNDKTYQGSDGVAVRAAAYRKMPNMSVYEYDALGNMSNRYFAPYTDNYQDAGTVSYNPLALAEEAVNNSTSNRVNTQLSLNYQIVPTLTATVDLSLDIQSVKNKATLPGIATGASWNDPIFNQVTEKDEEAIRTQTFAKLIWQPNFGTNHRLTGLASFSTYDARNISSMARVNGNPSHDITDTGVGGRIGRLAASDVRMRNVAALVNFNYVAFDRYIVTAGIRTDGDSRFGAGNKWGYFPSVSVAWRVSGESFMQWASEWLNDFKFRFSYGENGNAPSSKYSHYTRYSVGNSYIDSDLQGIAPSNIQLSNLKWETTVQKNFGFDYAILQHRISGSFEVYSKSSRDVIFDDVSIPGSSGYTSLQHMNWGIIDNKGWEFYINAAIVKNKVWDVSVNFNISQNRNVVSNIPENYNTEIFSFSNGTYARRIENGQPLGSFYGFKYLGVYSTPEDAIVRDKNGNVVYNIQTGAAIPIRAGSATGYVFEAGDARYADLNNDGIIDMYDIAYLGNSNPRFVGGFGFNVRWKKVSLGTFFHYKTDYDVINMARMRAENMYNRDNQAVSTLGRWRRVGDQTDIPRALYNKGYNWLGSDRFVEDASFLRLKSINLSYVLDGKAIKNAGLNNIRVFMTLYNPFTWTKYTGQDPEVSMNGTDVFSLGVDNARTPVNKSVLFGVNVSF